MIRILSYALLAAVAAGCGDQRSFDERFSDSQNEIEERADRIDRELANSSETPEADASPSPETR